MTDDPIEVNPTPPADPGPGEPMTAEALNDAVSGFTFHKFVEHAGGMKAAFFDGPTVVFDGVDGISVVDE